MGSELAVLVLTDCVVLSLTVVVLAICLCSYVVEAKKSRISLAKAKKRNYFSDYFPVRQNTLKQINKHFYVLCNFFELHPRTFSWYSKGFGKLYF